MSDSRTQRLAASLVCMALASGACSSTSMKVAGVASLVTISAIVVGNVAAPADESDAPTDFQVACGLVGISALLVMVGALVHAAPSHIVGPKR